MEKIVVSKEGVTKLLKGLKHPSKALGPDALHPRVLIELATSSNRTGNRVRPSIFPSLNSQLIQVKSLKNGL